MSEFTSEHALALVRSASPLSPDLTLNGRTGAPVPLTAAHRDALDVLTVAANEHEGIPQADGDGATLSAGAILTPDLGVGVWSITAHHAGGARWLTASALDGEVEAQLDVDWDDLPAFAFAAHTLWGWATVGPAVY